MSCVTSNIVFSLSESLACVIPPNVVAAEVSTSAGILVVADEAVLLIEGVAKGGYPVDIAAQSTLDLTSIGQSELGCANALIASGLESAAAGQLELGYTALDVQGPYVGEQAFPSSISEVIRPMEMAELVDIMPTLSLIEEETPSFPSVPSVMDMLESFGLGIGENSTFLSFENSNLTTGDRCLAEPDLSHNKSSSSGGDTHSETTGLQGQDMSATGGDVPGWSWDFPSEDKETQQVPSKGLGFPARNQVEWDNPSNSSS